MVLSIALFGGEGPAGGLYRPPPPRNEVPAAPAVANHVQFMIQQDPAAPHVSTGGEPSFGDQDPKIKKKIKWDFWNLAVARCHLS